MYSYKKIHVDWFCLHTVLHNFNKYIYTDNKYIHHSHRNLIQEKKLYLCTLT